MISKDKIEKYNKMQKELLDLEKEMADYFGKIIKVVFKCWGNSVPTDWWFGPYDCSEPLDLSGEEICYSYEYYGRTDKENICYDDLTIPVRYLSMSLEEIKAEEMREVNKIKEAKAREEKEKNKEKNKVKKIKTGALKKLTKKEREVLGI